MSGQWRRRTGVAWSGATWIAAALLLAARPAAATDPPPTLHPGSLEAGLSGGLVSRTGATDVDLLVRFGWLIPVGSGGRMLPVELGAGWSHVRMVDTAEFSLSAQWTGGLGAAPTMWPFVGAVAALRQDWIGSFREARYPVGGVVGLRLLATDRAAFRAEYRLLRVLGDPVEDFTEHRLLFGLSLFFPPEG